MKTPPIPFKAPPELMRKVDILAFRLGITRSELVRQFLIDFLGTNAPLEEGAPHGGLMYTVKLPFYLLEALDDYRVRHYVDGFMPSRSEVIKSAIIRGLREAPKIMKEVTRGL
jgi:metal-responsive CopG/Arc/MetJ family transcriptional regulator